MSLTTEKLVAKGVLSPHTDGVRNLSYSNVIRIAKRAVSNILACSVLQDTPMDVILHVLALLCCDCEPRFVRPPFFRFVCPRRKFLLLGRKVAVYPDLRGLLLVARPSSRYLRLLQQLPIYFVGTIEELRSLAQRMAIEAGRSLEEAGMQIPPWRKPDTLVKFFDHEDCSTDNELHTVLCRSVQPLGSEIVRSSMTSVGEDAKLVLGYFRTLTEDVQCQENLK